MSIFDKVCEYLNDSYERGYVAVYKAQMKAFQKNENGIHGR